VRGLAHRFHGAQDRLWKGDAGRSMARDIIGEFAKQVLEGEITVAKDTETMINARIAQIDALITRQLNEIMHAAEFQKLEASWRGLHYLVNKSETSTMLKIRVMNATKLELSKDLEKAVEFDQSALFKKVYEEEYGMFGGAPFGTLIGDYEFGKHPQDLSLLEKISNVAAAAHAPFISAASPELLNLESFTQLDDPRDLAKIFDTTEYAKWRSFRESEDSRYVGLAAPHILMRLPYGQETAPVEAFRFEEDVFKNGPVDLLFIEFAVNIPEQLPIVGQPLHSSSFSSDSVILPTLNWATPSKMLIKSTVLPSAVLPAAIGPPETKIVGILSLTEAISMPGTTLSQFGIQIRPSKQCALTIASTASAIISREAREYFIPL
jgi:hypothetical protein